MVPCLGNPDGLYSCGERAPVSSEKFHQEGTWTLQEHWMMSRFGPLLDHSSYICGRNVEWFGGSYTKIRGAGTDQTLIIEHI